MKKICVIGAFRLISGPRGGQEIKTCVIADELEKIYGKVCRIDTVGFINHILLPVRLIYALFWYTNVIILPAHNGLIIEANILRYLNLLFNRRLFYVVIGGWLHEILPHHKITAKSLKHFFGIYVETSTMKNELNKLGYTNVIIFPNLKPYSILPQKEQYNLPIKPYKLCTFSRVSEMKGIETAVSLINKINMGLSKPVYTLDIYGPLEKSDIPWIEKLKTNFSEFITYKGVAPFDKSTSILSNYFALLFPTKFYTEGIPGTIMDAYAAGLPVISSKWKSFSDVIDESVTGYGYEFNNTDELERLLIDIANSPEKIISLKNNCLKKAEIYLPKNVLPLLDIK